jgi:hypothetical protein
MGDITIRKEFEFKNKKERDHERHRCKFEDNIKMISRVALSVCLTTNWTIEVRFPAEAEGFFL